MSFSDAQNLPYPENCIHNWTAQLLYIIRRYIEILDLETYKPNGNISLGGPN